MATDKKPKGILKTASSFDNPPTERERKSSHSKEMKWDEMNILATHHPPDKDYGHMKIDEPPTPYSKYSDPEDEDEEMARRNSVGKLEDLDPESVASRLQGMSGEKGQSPCDDDDDDESSDEDLEETPEEKEKRKLFEQKRKLHYNEFQAVKLAKQLMAEEDEDDDDDVDDKNNSTKDNNIADSELTNTTSISREQSKTK